MTKYWLRGLRRRVPMFGALALALSAGCATSHDRDEDASSDPADVGLRDASLDPISAFDSRVCRAETCDGADEDCDGVVDDEALCSLPGATAGCIDGRCAVVACELGRASCDGDHSDGCEVDTTTDRQNCGACGVPCGMTETCEGGTCVRELILDVAPGDMMTCVVLGSGRVLCWGTNEYGSLGPEYPPAGSPVPVEIHGLPPDVVDVAVGDASGFVTTSTGDGWAWGWNADGELGTGVATRDPQPPTRIAVGEPILGVFTSWSSACAMNTDQRLWCWGDYAGSTPFMGHPTPRRIELGGPVHVLAGMAGGWFAGTGVGQVTWGADAYGIRGSEPATGLDNPVAPFPLSSLPLDAHCAAHCCAVLSSGGVVACWGTDYLGALGNGLPDDARWDGVPPIVYHDPVESLAPRGAIHVVAIGETYNDVGACARYPGGEVYCWGGPTSSGLGHQSSEPERLALPDLGASGLYAARGGCVRLFGDRQLLCWGLNWYGELGDGSVGRPSPVPVPVVGFE